jgi:NAD(P)-dependent dehydrogenase (short-subunit alcohol dehydrogenase family)
MFVQGKTNMTKWIPADIPSLHGRLGWHTALELARAGSEVILASRTEAKGRDAVYGIRQEVPQARVRAEVLELASLQSVQSFAAKIDREAKLDLLTNNAGVMSVPTRQATEDGRLATRPPAFPHGAFVGTSLLLLVDVFNCRVLSLSTLHRLQGETHA